MAHAHAHDHEDVAHGPPKGPPGGHETGFLKTRRSDNWWIEPFLTASGLTIFLVYATLIAWNGSHYVAGPYMSPFFAPLFFVKEGVAGGASVNESLFGVFPSWWPSWAASPAFLVIPLPSMFRGTCYYYRKAYYRSFFGLPAACAVGPMQYGKYEGETSLLIFQNLHRYALYLALLLLPVLYWHAAKSCFFEGHFGFGVGTIMMFVNATLLAGYTFGCHSWRHLVGGRVNCFSCNETSFGAWKRVSWLNERHMNFAWMSLIWFLCTDVYIRLCSYGVISDLNTWHGRGF